MKVIMNIVGRIITTDSKTELNTDSTISILFILTEK